MRQQIKDVMRYAAPRMMFTHPILSFSHLKSTIKGKRKKKKEKGDKKCSIKIYSNY